MDISNLDWNGILDNLSPEEAVAIYYENIYGIIRLHTPIRKYKSTNFPVWFTINLINIYKKNHGVNKVEKIQKR